MDGKGGSKQSSASNNAGGGNTNNVRTASNTSLNDALKSLQGEGNITPPEKKGSITKGAGAVAKRYVKPAAGAIIGAGTGLAGGVLGFAAGASQGDITAALAGAAAGRKAGSNLGHGAVNLGADILNTPQNVKNKLNELEDIFNEGAYGTEYAESIKSIRDFKGSSAYSELKSKYGDNLTDDALATMLEAGINNKRDMDKILQGNNISDSIGYYTLAKKCPDSIYFDDKKLQDYLEKLGLNETDAKTMRDNMRKFK